MLHIIARGNPETGSFLFVFICFPKYNRFSNKPGAVKIVYIDFSL